MLEKELEETLERFKDETRLRQEQVEKRDHETKKWVEQSLKMVTEELNTGVNRKMAENEVTVRKILLKGGGGSGAGMKESEMKALKEKNLLEYIDVVVKNLREELKTEFEEDKSKKNSRLDEVTRLINANKGMMDEHVTQQGESLKALLKAHLNEEALYRNREDEKILALLNKRFEVMEKYLESKFKEEELKMTLKVDTNLTECHKTRDIHDNHIQVLQDKLGANMEKMAVMDDKVNNKLQGMD